MIVALLLSPDDELIERIAMPSFKHVICVAKPDPRPWMYCDRLDDREYFPSIIYIEFEYCPRESEFYRVLENNPDVCVYRQCGWNKEREMATT